MLTIITLCWFVTVVLSQSIPQIQPINTTLYAQTGYSLNYFTLKSLKIVSYFQINFAKSNIIVNDGLLSCNASYSDQQVPVLGSCLNSICRINMTKNSSANTRVLITFATLRNPYYLSSQKINVVVYFNPNEQSEQYNITISMNVYEPMKIILNSFKQSDQGVGSTNAEYIFNLSLPFIPKNPSLQISIPSQISYGNIQHQLSFYNTVQNINFFQASSILIFNLIYQQNTNPQGYMILKLKGFINPQYIGNSTSFTILIEQTQAKINCGGCRVAQINNGIEVSATQPGDIQILTFNADNKTISIETNIIINNKLFAPIPQGGKYLIKLPANIQPSLPIVCDNVYGFEIIDNNNPICLYNESQHSIETINFAYPFLVSQGNAIISIRIINPSDNRINIFSFQTMDSLGRNIGKSRRNYTYNAIPIKLNQNVTKNKTEIDTEFTTEIKIILQKQLNSTNIIRIIFPPNNNYELNKIQCISSTLKLNCNKTIDSNTNYLNIDMNPPCVQCGIGAQLIFQIINLRNPLFINQAMQSIYLQTRNLFGIIEANVASIALTPAQLTISHYQRLGEDEVGSTYTYNMTVSLPTYIENNGGKIKVIFDENDTYINVEVGSVNNIYNYISSGVVYDQNDNELKNEIIYYEGQPKSVKMIIIDVCTQNKVCPNMIIIINLRKSFTQISQLQQKIIATTINKDTIAQKQINILQNKSKIKINYYSINITNSKVNQISSYIIQFITQSIPFDSGFIIKFEKQFITSTCFIITNSTYYTSQIFNCQIQNNNSIIIQYLYDRTLMMKQYIQYTITIKQIKNPTSIIPINIQFNLQYNNKISQKYYTNYTIKQPYQLKIEINKSNNTLNQKTNITLIFQSGFPQFNSMQIIIFKQLFHIQNTYSISSYTLQQNSTYYLIKNIYTLSNTSSITFQIINPNSTASIGSVIVQTYIKGYLSAKGTQLVQAVEPILLSAQVSINNRVVAAQSQLVIQVNRFSQYVQQNQIIVELPQGLFTYDNAQFDGDKLNKTSSQGAKLTVPIASTNRIVIKKLNNMHYIPSNSSIVLLSIKVSTVDAADNPIARTTLDIVNIVPNETVDGKQYSFIRTKTESNAVTHIEISYEPRLAKIGSKMLIQLPITQNQIDENSTCTIQLAQNITRQCKVYFRNLSTIQIQYQGQIKTILRELINLYPSQDKLKLYILTQNNQYIEKSQKLIQPYIKLNKLEIISKISTNYTNRNNQIYFTIKPLKNQINSNSKLQIVIPQNIFTKWNLINNKLCSYQILDIISNNCKYFQYSNGSISSIIIDLGPLKVQVGSIIKIWLYLTNFWASSAFQHQQLLFKIYNTNFMVVSQGVASLAYMFFPNNAFSLTTLPPVNTTVSSLKASSESSIQFSIHFNLPIPQNTTLVIYIPKNVYQLSTSSSNDNINNHQTHFIIKKQLTCTQRLCLPNNTISLQTINVINSKYVPKNPDQIILYLQYGSNRMTNYLAIEPQLFNPSLLSTVFINRSINTAYSETIISIEMNFTTISDNFSLSIKGLLYPLTLRTISQIFQVGNRDSLVYSIIGNELILQIEKNISFLSLRLMGENVFLVPIQKQQYIISLYNETVIYYISDRIQMPQKLIPQSTGITILRQNTTVNTKTILHISGILLKDIIPQMNLTINGTNITINSSIFNITYGQMYNVASIFDIYLCQITIGNQKYIAYYNNSNVIKPDLTPRIMTQFKEISFPTQIQIESIININVKFKNKIQLKYLKITFPKFINKLITCCYKQQQSLCSIQNIKNYELISIENENNQQIELKLNKNINISQIIFKIQIIQYQRIYKNIQINILSDSPSSINNEIKNINIISKKLQIELLNTLLKINQLVNYNFIIKTIKNNCTIEIIIPKYINQQIQANISTIKFINIQHNNNNIIQPQIQQLNHYILYLPKQISIIRLQINNVINPSDNRSIIFNFIQKQAPPNDNNNFIYGRNQYTINMIQFDRINVTSARRNSSKISEICSLNVTIQSPSYQQSMFIRIPISQLIINNDHKCTVQVDNMDLNCTYIGNNTIKTSNLGGEHTYIINGFHNAQFIQQSQNDKIYIEIGQPYKKAQTINSTTVFIYPLITTGTIIINQFKQNIKQKLSFTTLYFNLTLQNYNQVTCIIFSFNSYNYLYNTIKCKYNNKNINCQLKNNNQIYIYITILSNIIEINIDGIINFIQMNLFNITTIKSISNKTYALIDTYNSKQIPFQFISSTIQLRLIIINNYISNVLENIIAIIDRNIQFKVRQLLQSKLFINISLLGCSKSAIIINQTSNILCTFSQAGSFSFQFVIYHQQFPHIALTSNIIPYTILPETHGQCKDQQCDSCSNTQQGEYCFSCRQGLAITDGKCTNQCPKYFFSYTDNKICTPCQPSCSSCYNLYAQNCLSCYNSSLVLQKGICQTQCTIGFQYKKYCVNNQQCSQQQGCKLCADEQFCYQCLPDYQQQPRCIYQQLLPSLFMSYFILPFAIIAILIIIYQIVRCYGMYSILSQVIFISTLLQTMIWVLIIPALNSIALSMTILFFIIVRIIISIVSHEMFYSKALGELSHKLLQQQCNKQDNKNLENKLDEDNSQKYKVICVRLFSHFIAPDSYSLLSSKISQPVSIVPIKNIFILLIMINRLCMILVFIYILSKGYMDDLLYIPIIGIFIAIVSSLSRLLLSSNVQNCLNRTLN